MVQPNELVVGKGNSLYEIRFIEILPNNDDSIIQVYSYAIYKKDEARIIDLIYVHRINGFVRKYMPNSYGSDKNGVNVEVSRFFIVSNTPISSQVSVSSPTFESFEMTADYLHDLCERKNEVKI